MTVRPAPGSTRERAPRLGLSGKLLVLTILFVMIAEVLIYVPSIANYRLSLLNDRLSAAYTAALVFQVARSGLLRGWESALRTGPLVRPGSRWARPSGRR